MAYTDEQLAYASTSRCSCGAGLAHPLDNEEAMKLGAWVCSAVLRDGADAAEHEGYPFAFYEIKSEFQPSAHGATTRPPGTAPFLVPECHCKACGAEWTLKAHPPTSLAPAGQCPRCGNTNGSDLSARYGGDAPPAIEARYRSVVVPNA